MRVVVLFLFFFAGLAQITMAQNDPLQAYRWTHRLLLVFTPNDATESAQSLRAALDREACGLAERDMLVGWFSAMDGGRLGGETISDGIVALLRARLDVAAGEYGVFLIGKDGGVKGRYAETPVLEEIFALIDGMPMRRAEMRSRPDVCEG
jgi:hypothetical protein